MRRAHADLDEALLVSDRIVIVGVGRAGPGESVTHHSRRDGTLVRTGFMELVGALYRVLNTLCKED